MLISCVCEIQAIAELLGDDGMASGESDAAFTWFEQSSGVPVRAQLRGCYHASNVGTPY